VTCLRDLSWAGGIILQSWLKVLGLELNCSESPWIPSHGRMGLRLRARNPGRVLPVRADHVRAGRNHSLSRRWASASPPGLFHT